MLEANATEQPEDAGVSAGQEEGKKVGEMRSDCAGQLLPAIPESPLVHFSSMGREQLAEHSDEIVDVLLDGPDAELRLQAVGLLGELGAEELVQHSQQMIEALFKESRAEVRWWTVNVLHKLAPGQLGRHSHRIMKVVLYDADARVHRRALHLLEKVGPELESVGPEHDGKHIMEQIVEAILKDTDAEVRRRAVRVLTKMAPEHACFDYLFLGEEDLDEYCQQLVEVGLRELCTFTPELLQERCHEFAGMMKSLAYQQKGRLQKSNAALTLLHCTGVALLASQEGWQHQLHFRAMVTEWRGAKLGNSLLHLAAKAGNLPVCRILVEDMHSSLRDLNGEGMEPREVTSCPVVESYLSKRIAALEARADSTHEDEQMMRAFSSGSIRDLCSNVSTTATCHHGRSQSSNRFYRRGEEDDPPSQESADGGAEGASSSMGWVHIQEAAGFEEAQIALEAAHLSKEVYSTKPLSPTPSAPASGGSDAGSRDKLNARITLLHFAEKSAQRPIQWLLARSEFEVMPLYVTFFGAEDLDAAVLDIVAAPLAAAHTLFGVGAHSSMYAALQQESPYVDVLQEVVTELKRHRRGFELIVLCGHSLGGGYAQLVALYLLHQSFENIKVQTFGSPHVVVPPAPDHEEAAKDLWEKLAACSEHWVQVWDPIPRLPLCQTWLTEVLPGLRSERLGLQSRLHSDSLEKPYLEERLSMLSKYDVAGKIVLVSSERFFEAYDPDSQDSQRSQKELLNEVPPHEAKTVQSLQAHHLMEAYLSIAEQL